MKQTLLLILLSLLACVSAAGSTLQLETDEQQHHFSYQFTVASQPQKLAFTISNSVIATHFRQFRRFSPALLQQYLWRDIKAHVANYPGARIQRQDAVDTLRYRLQLRDQNLLQRLQQELEHVIDQRTAYYLQQEYYYQHPLALGEQVIIPDHVRFAQDSLRDLLPVAEALHSTLQNMPSRDSVNYISHWIQQIPYQDLSDRQRSSGNSFSPPLALLQQHRGDCDSKTVLLATLLRLLLPDVKLAFIYLPEHAMLAVQLPVTATDDAVSIKNQRYLLVDPTGPALLPAGEVSPEMRLYTVNNQFSYRLF
uniref:Uncharacterized secreted protein n=1 Tax=Rheinheimera sp. BAL341 TaxID=1708203 RepID=A0A486XTH0_9GAMM